MIGLAVQTNGPRLKASDTLNDSNLQLLLVEDGALLNVKLQVGGYLIRRAASLQCPHRIKPLGKHRILELNAIQIPRIEHLVRNQTAGERFGTEGAAESPFLIAEGNELDGVLGNNACLPENTQALESDDNAESAIKHACTRNGVDMRANVDPWTINSAF